MAGRGEIPLVHSKMGKSRTEVTEGLRSESDGASCPNVRRLAVDLDCRPQPRVAGFESASSGSYPVIEMAGDIIGWMPLPEGLALGFLHALAATSWKVRIPSDERRSPRKPLIWVGLSGYPQTPYPNPSLQNCARYR
jgi:hypothetical protein